MTFTAGYSAKSALSINWNYKPSIRNLTYIVLTESIRYEENTLERIKGCGKSKMHENVISDQLYL